MYFGASEHNPPHFHVAYGEYSGIFSLQDLNMIEGDLPSKAQNMVVEWASQHKNELMEIWNTQKFIEIPPLV